MWRTTETFRKRWVCRKTGNELVDVELLDYPIRKCNSETEKRERRFDLESSRVVPCGAHRLIFIGMREVALKPAPAWRSLQSLRIFRSQSRVSSINFKAASDATCNTFSGALPNSPSWPCSLFPRDPRVLLTPLTSRFRSTFQRTKTRLQKLFNSCNYRVPTTWSVFFSFSSFSGFFLFSIRFFFSVLYFVSDR